MLELKSCMGDTAVHTHGGPRSRNTKCLNQKFFHRTTFKIPTFFVNAIPLGEKLKKVPFWKKKAGFRLKIFQRRYCPLFIHSHFTKFEAISSKARKRYLFFSLKRYLQKREKV